MENRMHHDIITAGGYCIAPQEIARAKFSAKAETHMGKYHIRLRGYDIKING